MPPNPELEDYARSLEATRLGPITVRHLNLPPIFLDRIAGRSLRAHYRLERYGLRSGTELLEQRPLPTLEANLEEEGEPATAGARVRLTTVELPPEALAPWRRVRQGMPESPSFKAPLGSDAPDPTMDLPDDPELLPTARLVARSLPSDGLVQTALLAILNAPQLEWTTGDEPKTLNLELCRRLGLPADLLAMFEIDGRSVTLALAEWRSAGCPPDQISRIANAADFAFQPTAPGFTIFGEDGGGEVAALRGQLRIGRASADPDFGSPVDILLAMRAENVICAIGAPEVADLRRSAAAVRSNEDQEKNPGPGRQTTLTLVPVPFPMGQWGRDNAVVGLAPSASDDMQLVAVHLLPRYASINEHISTFLPAESLVFAYLEEAIGPCRQSPLLFQGGNLLAATQPATGERLLFIGEAEVHRNVGLGLSREQVLNAFRIEFGVDACIVLPAVSFHIDMEMTARAVGDELHAHVLDDQEGAQLILDAGLRRLGRRNAIDPPTIDEWRTALAGDDPSIALAGIRSRLAPWARAADAIPMSSWEDESQPAALARLDAARFIAAADTLLAAQPVGVRTRLAADARESRYLDSIAHRLDERSELIASLKAAGLIVHTVPGLGDDQFPVNPLNALQLTDAVYVPIIGDGGLDQAALGAFRRVYGPSVDVRGIPSSVGQGMYGGLHCMFAPTPAPIARDEADAAR